MSFLMDFTELPQSNFLYGGNAGLKRGVIWNGLHWLIKFPQETSTFDKVDISLNRRSLNSSKVNPCFFNILSIFLIN